MATERVLSNLNLISFKTEGGLQNHIDELQEGDLVFTPDNSLKGTLLDFKWADHLLNDMSWLRADTFSWQSGDVYVAAYNHLVTDFENAVVNHWYAWAEIGGGIWYTKTPTVAVGDTVYNSDFSVFGQVDTVYSGTNFTIGANDFIRSASDDITVGDTETIDGIEITYYRAEDKHKICLPDQEDKVLALYNKTGVAWYYILDTENKQFKLPRRHSKQIVRSVKNADGSWYRLYADGWVEQGGYKEIDSGGSATISLPIAMVDTNYSAQMTPAENASGSSPRVAIIKSNLTTTTITLNWYSYNNGQAKAYWQVSGQSAIDTSSLQDSEKHLYFYVGNFEKEAIEQTAGIAAEMFNGKADVSRVEVLEGYDYVVESQMPTEANGYTWYRKYKSGWVEQGGVFTAKTGGITFSIVYPIQMLDTNYCALLGETDNGSNNQYIQLRFLNKTTTGASIYANLVGTHTNSWQVSGMSV